MIRTITLEANDKWLQLAANEIPKDTDCIIIDTHVEKEDLVSPYKYSEEDSSYLEHTNQVIKSASMKIKPGGTLFIYGSPRWLPYFSKFLSEETDMAFKYWIALDIANEPHQNGLVSSHVGLLLHVKGSNSPYKLNTDSVRVPYVACSYCGKNTKDWGGKKHLINKLGSCISDVWKDYYKINSVVEDTITPGLKLNLIDTETSRVADYSSLPEVVKERILSLIDGEMNVLIDCKFRQNKLNHLQTPHTISLQASCKTIQEDIYLGDSIQVMQEWVEKYPEGCFDLIFADPPYNLDKDYKDYNDKEKDNDYIHWCNEWLTLCSRLLTPNGALFVLNLPKWSIHHAVHLNSMLYFQNWIIWDALSTPKGKIMPAHYSLLYYTKSLSTTFNNINEYTITDTQDHCLRASCVNKRYMTGVLNGKRLSDLWVDVSRIKHKRDRDDHPCQLPDKLMERIIEVFCPSSGFVFDPFSGTGTTPIAAKRLGKKYAAIDISEDYVEIGKAKLRQLDVNGSITKASIKKAKYKISKKQVEIYIQNVCTQLGYRPSENEFIQYLANDAFTDFSVDDILVLYPDIKTALKSGRIALK